MTSQDFNASTHPVLACAASIESSLKSVADVNPSFMTVGDKRTALVELSRLNAELESLRLRVIAASGDVAEADGMPNVASWLTPRTHSGSTVNHQTEKLAISLDTDWTLVAEALAAGAMNLEQAKVIVSALDRVATGDVPPDVLHAAEAHLVELAESRGPDHLRVLGRKILSVVAADLCDDEERKRLEEEERRANAKSRLWFKRNGDGTVELRAKLSEAAAARLKGVLDALTSPRHNNLDTAAAPLVDPATGKKIPFDERRGQLAGTGAATMPDGSRISASQARRLACAAKLIPAVLDGTSEVLDQGRAKRLFTGAQVTAMGIRDKSCRAEGCQVPARWCEAHHFTTSWARGGRTDVKDGKLLCPFHHRCAHDDRYDMRLLPDGDVRFHKRT